MILPKSSLIAGQHVIIGGSKSLSNRLLILQKLFGYIDITNLSEAADTKVLQFGLDSSEKTIDIHHAGTAMRFLTAYFAGKEGSEVILTGSARMKQRPIEPLVTVLRELGAEIQYMEKEGFPPLKISGKKLRGGKASIDAGISSQFITALLLIGGNFEKGLQLQLQGEITSRPYIEMTLRLLTLSGIKNSFTGNLIKVEPQIRTDKTSTITVESDWSSASYIYSLCALGKQEISLSFFQKDSLQGDGIVKEIYSKYFGVETEFAADGSIKLVPAKNFQYPEHMKMDMNACPDLAQTVAVTAAAVQIPFHFTGLATLKVKETDRISALHHELLKIGCRTIQTDSSLASIEFFKTNGPVRISTYDDHRMAMSFAPYALISQLEIEHPEVVEKSYPEFWKHLETVLVSHDKL